MKLSRLKSFFPVTSALNSFFLKYSILLFIFLSSCSENEKSESEEPNSDIQSISFAPEMSCNFFKMMETNSAYLFKADTGAKQTVDEIMKKTGLPSNFKLYASDVGNAAALIKNGERFILYNQNFIDEVMKKTGTAFGPLSVFAHEVGHHLAGHTMKINTARPFLELEADRFSGFILSKMGASLDEACTVINTYGSKYPSKTHPAKASRIAAITNGWKEGNNDAEENISPSVAASGMNGEIFLVDVQSSQGFITLRNRSLNPDEYKLSNSGTEAGRILNDSTIIMQLFNGTEVEVLSTINNTYLVKVKTEKGEKIGFITRLYNGISTVKKKS